MFYKPVYIIGNGPSLRGFNFAKKLHDSISFGMNLAYRFWHKINWYPTYYSCLDSVVASNHVNDIGNLVYNSTLYGIKRFFLRQSVIASLGIQNFPNVDCYESMLSRYPFAFRSHFATTGSGSLAWAMWLGYRNIILLGMDAQYRKYVEGSSHIDKITLQIVKQPSVNPNYFFDNYQQVGDIYHVPEKAQEDIYYEHQLLCWHMLSPQIHATNSVIVNANMYSCITAFPKCTFAEAKQKIKQERKKKRNIKKKHATSVINTYLTPLDLAFSFYKHNPGTFIDIGAHNGCTAINAARHGWKVHIAEPDVTNRNHIENQTSQLSISIESCAVSCCTGREYPWYVHNDSQLNAMQDITGHGIKSGIVKTISTHDMFSKFGIKHVNILHIDINGFEYMVLRGLKESLLPETIILTYENNYSLKLGTDIHDTASFLIYLGYVVLIAEKCNSKQNCKICYNLINYYNINLHNINNNGILVAIRQDRYKICIKKTFLFKKHKRKQYTQKTISLCSDGYKKIA